MKFFLNHTKRRPGSTFLPPFLFLASLILLGSACGSLTVTRPVQEMSDTVAALRAAKEVSADSLAPELYRRANEAYLKARNEYRFKNFVIARDLAIKSRKLAEKAEYEALKKGAQRASTLPPEEPPPPPPEPYAYPTPRGTPGFLLESEEARQQSIEAQGQEGVSAPSGSAPSGPASPMGRGSSGSAP